MALLFVTSNKYKFAEVQSILTEYEIELEQCNEDLPEISSTSAEEIAVEKAKAAFQEIKEPLIVEDTAVYFEAYKDFPGTQPKRMYEALGLEGLLKLLSGKDRKAHFKSVICFADSSSNHKTFSGEWHGKILKKEVKPKADRMPYEKIFVPDGNKKAVVEMPLQEKNRVSHRSIAARELAKWLKDRALEDLVDSI